MATPNPPGLLRHLRMSDLRSVAMLATQATTEVTRIAEGVHQSVRARLGARSGAAADETAGLTGMVYRGVRGATRLAGQSVDAVLAGIEPLVEPPGQPRPETPQRAAVLAALNGVLGDRLAAANNPLATRMALRYNGLTLAGHTMPPHPEVTGKVLLLLHGLCMNDLQWHTGPAAEAPEQVPAEGITHGHDHGQAIAQALGYTPIYLRYNTGLHISDNGQQLSAALEHLLQHWPVPVHELSILGYSMGGLVARSAAHAAAQKPGLRWPGYLKHLVFLGTPHHGAPLERASQWLHELLGRNAATKPFTRLVALRSAGITDLRHGNLVEADWQGLDRFQRGPDARRTLPLPEGVACYAVAATVAAKRHALAERVIGDGLVPLHSALGRNADAARSLVFARDAQWVAYRTNHLQLLSNPEVARQIVRWLRPADAAEPAGA
eukprot:TRINITY_DN17289_c0_g1_i1.p1 TRINITY_DN17289_c0_g1~~TRINITY_DN17289_c0_g1_i1.p1  ORF type:complete len:437 (+),score=136.37 TRINITY_DN17289_c0_g1_i1:69-1379(+)